MTRPQKACRGERNGRSKLTDGQVREIREIYAAGEVSQELLAKQFGVCQSSICRIVRREWWSHI
jgi:IS30 family transposase